MVQFPHILMVPVSSASTLLTYQFQVTSIPNIDLKLTIRCLVISKGLYSIPPMQSSTPTLESLYHVSPSEHLLEICRRQPLPTNRITPPISRLTYLLL